MYMTLTLPLEHILFMYKCEMGLKCLTQSSYKSVLNCNKHQKLVLLVYWKCVFDTEARHMQEEENRFHVWFILKYIFVDVTTNQLFFQSSQNCSVLVGKHIIKYFIIKRVIVLLGKKFKLQVFVNKISKRVSGQKGMTNVSNFRCFITINLVVLLVLRSQGF